MVVGAKQQDGDEGQGLHDRDPTPMVMRRIALCVGVRRSARFILFLWFMGFR